MFHNARINLTLLYSFIFLVLFWSLSFGIYFWMNQYFGDKAHNDIFTQETTALQVSDNESDRIMDRLRNILFLLDLALLVGIPVITWILTGKTLEPIQKAHEREKQFLANASHDLRTPLTIMSAEMEVAMRKKRNAEDYHKTLVSSKEEVDELIALVENLLFINRETGNIQDEQLERIDLTDILADRIHTFHLPAKKKQQTITFVPSQESLTIRGSQQQIKRLFTNLIDNALKYTPAKGKITVTLMKEQQTACVIITDTGRGMRQEQQEQAFDRFYRGDTSRSEKGYGLGLSIAQAIVTAYQGTITIQSKLNQGTTITMRFPLAKD